MDEKIRADLIAAEIAAHDRAEADGAPWIAKRANPIRRAWLEAQYRFWKGFYRAKRRG